MDSIQEKQDQYGQKRMKVNCLEHENFFLHLTPNSCGRSGSFDRKSKVCIVTVTTKKKLSAET